MFKSTGLAKMFAGRMFVTSVVDDLRLGKIQVDW